MPEAFFAFAGSIAEVREAIRQAVERCRATKGSLSIVPWTDLDVSGRLIQREVLAKIDKSAIFLADISVLNMNVSYEAGYAIGTHKPIRLVVNDIYKSDLVRMTQRVGIFDTVGFRPYSNGIELADYLIQTRSNLGPLFIPEGIDRKAPVYVLDAPHKTDLIVRITQTAKRMFISPRIFDPREKARISAQEAIEHVAKSGLVIVSLLPPHYPESEVHNIRAAFLAGLAHGMARKALIFQLGEDAPPLDFRDDVTLAQRSEQIDAAITAVAPEVMRTLLRDETPHVAPDRTFLEGLNVGSSVAEEEEEALASYYYPTDAFHRAMRGEARVVLGRKGSGKSALFYEVARRKKANRQNVVLDLQPESYQLIKFKEDILRLFQPGTQLHLLTAMWDYVLLLETAFRLLDIDEGTYHRNHKIFQAYVALKDLYYGKGVYAEADFSERLSVLIEDVRVEILERYPSPEGKISLGSNEITEIIYKHPIAELRQCLAGYLREKGELWILVDHLDKGWSSSGLKDEDVQIVRALLDACGKLQRALSRSKITCHAIVFLRSDVFEFLVENTPDSGKINKVMVDWTDKQALKHMLALRLAYAGLPRDLSFDGMWLRICSSEVAGQSSADFILARCLMRPRALLGHVAACRNRAVNRGHDMIEEEDLREGVRDYSRDLLRDVMQEIKDVAPELEDALYALIDTPASFSRRALHGFFKAWQIPRSEWDSLIDRMLWYGVLGVEVGPGQIRYIYDVNYDAELLNAAVRRVGLGCTYWLNPAFRPALAVSEPPEGSRPSLL